MEAADLWLSDGEKLLLIDGRLVRAADGGLREIIEPATGAPLATVASGGVVDALLALGAARRAVDDGPWPRMGAHERGLRLEELAHRVASDEGLLARLEARDSGRPLREAVREVRWAANALRREAERAAREQGGWRRSGTLLALAEPAPLGVVCAAAGAHAPIRSAIAALAPALAAGNAVIVLPDVRAPMTALRIGELALETGFPRGALQVLSGGRDAGTALAQDDALDLLLEDVGLEDDLWLRAARGARPMRTARRAKGTALVLAGADPVIAAEQILLGACYGQGAQPQGVQRVVAERKAHDHLVLQLISRACGLTLGNPIDPDCELGPLVSEGLRERADARIATARAQGATMVCGGQHGEDPRLAGGFYLQPTVLVNCHPGMASWSEDVPAPVLLVHEAEDVDAAVRAVPAAGPLGLFGALGRSLGRLEADQPGRDILHDTWNLPAMLDDPRLGAWRPEEFHGQRSIFRAEPDGPGWYFSS